MYCTRTVSVRKVQVQYRIIAIYWIGYQSKAGAGQWVSRHMNNDGQSESVARCIRPERARDWQVDTLRYQWASVWILATERERKNRSRATGRPGGLSRAYYKRHLNLYRAAISRLNSYKISSGWVAIVVSYRREYSTVQYTEYYERWARREQCAKASAASAAAAATASSKYRAVSIATR